MKAALIPQSLSARLLLGSALATLLALGVVLVLMHQVLTRFVTGQIDQRLDNKILALQSQVRAAPDGSLTLEGQADGPPFDKRHHRSFWIVQGPRTTLRTHWLTDADFVMPSERAIDAALRDKPPAPPDADPADRRPETLNSEGPQRTRFHERVLRTEIGRVPALILVAAPAAAISEPVREAMTTLGLGVLALGLALGALAFAQVRLGLRPLATLRTQVAEIGAGNRDLLPAGQPREILPLAVEMNNLLARNAANLDKARRHVANLAHGLKTPLATLQLGIERLDGPGKHEFSLLLKQIDLRVRHHLARARAAALTGPERARTMLGPRLSDIADALRHLNADRQIALTLDVPDTLAVACEGNDIDEIFGNLLDNACKFARTGVRCTAQQDGRSVHVEIADDGPGLGADDVAVVLQPGQRLDENVPGFGFGLTIARELVELYGGELRLEPAQTGLTAIVVLPAPGAVARASRAGLPQNHLNAS